MGELKSILDQYNLERLKRWVTTHTGDQIRREISDMVSDGFYILVLVKLLQKDLEFFINTGKGFSPYSLHVYGVDNIPENFLKAAGVVKCVVDMADDDEFYNSIVHKFVKIWTKEEALNELKKSDWLYGDEPVYDIFNDFVSGMYE